MSEQLANIFVLSNSSLASQDLIYQILGREEKDHKNKPEAIQHFLWTIETVYYQVDVNIYRFDPTNSNVVTDITTLKERDCEALIIVVDAEEQGNVRSIQEWAESLLNDQEPSILLFVENSVKGRYLLENEVEEYNNWCIDKGFEFVSLQKKQIEMKEENETFEKDFSEKVGLLRVMEALEANLWPGMTPLEKKVSNSPETFSETSSEKKDNPFISDIKKLEQVISNFKIASTDFEDFENEEKQFLSFENALQEFGEMRRKAQELPDDERREFAAQVASMFLKQFEDEEDEEE